MKLAKLFYGNTFLLYVVIPNLLWFKHYDRNQGRPRWPKRLLMASAWVLMEECNSVWMHTYSSNVCSIRLIPFQKFHHKSLPYWVWCLVELLQTDGAEDSGRFDIHPHCLEYVHIVYTSVKELSNSEGFKLIPLLRRNGDVIIVLDPMVSSSCRSAAQRCGPVLWGYEGRRPWWVKRPVVTLRVWRSASAGWTRLEHVLHLLEHLLHPATILTKITHKQKDLAP
jgi:hypothetical protein